MPSNDNLARNDQFVIRTALATDAAAIAQIYNHYIDLGGATFDTSHWTTDYVVDLLGAEPPEQWLVAVEGESVLGWASARRFSARFGYRFSLETAIYLGPTAFGRGIGDALQSRLEQHCQQCQIHHVMAKIVAGNQPSLAFHRRHGYQMVGIQNEIGHMQGRWVDVVILQKILPSTDR